MKIRIFSRSICSLFCKILYTFICMTSTTQHLCSLVTWHFDENNTISWHFIRLVIGITTTSAKYQQQKLSNESSISKKIPIYEETLQYYVKTECNYFLKNIFWKRYVFIAFNNNVILFYFHFNVNFTRY